MRKFAFVLAGVALIAGGCSTRPRTFNPVLAAPTADPAAYQRDLSACRTMVAQGKRSGFGDAAVATGTGAVAGAATGAAAVGTGAIPLGIGMSGAAAAALVAVMPLAGIAAGVGVTRAIRSGKEKKVKAALADCLAAHGHAVGSWQLVKKARKSLPEQPPSHAAKDGVADPPLP